MDIVLTFEPWYWLILLFLFLGAEALGTGGFLLGTAAASALMALVLWVSPEMGWPAQLMTFGTASFVFTLAYWKFFRKLNNKSDSPELNNRAMQLVGRTVLLEHDLPVGISKLQIGDTFWKVQSDRSVLRGHNVIVSGYRGIVLIVMEQP
ncbi:MAG: NfeD family protein [Endozoicomonas sp.]